MRKSGYVKQFNKINRRVMERNNRTVKKCAKEQGIDYYDFLRDFYSPQGQARSRAVGLCMPVKGSCIYKIKR